MEFIPKQFSSEELNTIIDLSKLLGAGSFGKVYKGRLKNGTEVAVKVLKEIDVVEEIFTAEARTMFTAIHMNIVKFYGFCFEDNMKALVYELMAGSLDTILYKKDPKIEWAELYDITIGIAEGLSYLHHQRIIHHDVKPTNVLLDINFFSKEELLDKKTKKQKKCSPKLTDFGVAKHMKTDSSHLTLTGPRGTCGYMAPEMLSHPPRVTYKCDVYSYGQMLFEVLSRKRNSSENEIWDSDGNVKTFQEQVWDKYREGRLEEMISDCGIKGGDTEKARILSMVGFWCIQFTPEVRPTMKKVINWLEKEIPVPDPSNPFLKAGSTLSLPSSQDRRTFVKWWLLLAKLVAIMFSKFQPQKLPSLELYMQELLEGPPNIAYQQLRMNKQVFIKLCKLFDQKKWLQKTEHFSIPEKIAIFLMKTNSKISPQFQCSNQKLNECFYEVLRAMLKFSKEMIVAPNYVAPVGNHCTILREGPFKGAVGALDGIVIYTVIRPRSKISIHCQNVLGVCDFDMKFVYVNAGLVDVDDSRMLDEALRQGDDIFPLPPSGKYYLYKSLCTHTDGFVSPYCNTRYRLQDFGNGDDIINKEEAFNHAHAQLRNVIDRAFGVLKARFSIMDDALPTFSPIHIRKNIVLACMAIHNFVRRESPGDHLFQTWERDGFLLTKKNHRFDPRVLNKLGEELVDMVNLRKEITNQLTMDTSYSYKV